MNVSKFTANPHYNDSIDKKIISSQSPSDIINCQDNKSENDEVSSHKMNEIKAIAIENIATHSNSTSI